MSLNFTEIFQLCWWKIYFLFTERKLLPILIIEILFQFNTVLNFNAKIYFSLLTEKRYSFVLKISSAIFFSNLFSILECNFFHQIYWRRIYFNYTEVKISVKFADRKVFSVKWNKIFFISFKEKTFLDKFLYTKLKQNYVQSRLWEISPA